MAASNLYAPVVPSTLPASPLSNQLIIPFSVPKVIQPNIINHVQIKISKQSSAEPLGDKTLSNTVITTKEDGSSNIVKYPIQPDGIIYEKYTPSGKNDFIILDYSKLVPEAQTEGLYKIQLRFGLNNPFNPSSSQNSEVDPLYAPDFSTWKQKQIKENAFSEWSAVILYKLISQPKVKILNSSSSESGSDTLAILGTEATVTPLFYGRYEIQTSDSTEVLDQYKFDLYEGELKVDELEKDKWPSPIESSGWLQYNSSTQIEQEPVIDGFYNASVKHRFKTMLVEQGTNDSDYRYTVIFSAKTANDYELSSQPYIFIVYPTYIENETLDSFTFTVVGDSQEYCNENACINLYLQSSISSSISGNFVIIRSDEKSNFTVWEDIKYLFFYEDNLYGNKKLVHQDYTIESGIRYKYALIFENMLGRRTMPIYHWDEVNNQEDKGYTVSVDFQYAYLYNNNVQLKLEFNNTISSFRHTVLATKQDTLGSKYPTILRNGHAYYAEFPITGLITLNMDENQGFFKCKESYSNKESCKNGYYYRDELVIPIDKFYSEYLDNEFKEGSFEPLYNPDSEFLYPVKGNIAGTEAEHQYIRYPDASAQELSDEEQLRQRIARRHTNYDEDYRTFNTNLTDNNIFIERKFREKVEEFLNDGGYKLYKSPTEGNIIVTLMNVTLTPNQTLGRMIYSFSATAYEVAEYTLETLSLYSIADIGKYTNYETVDADVVVGQIAKNFTGNENVFDLIKQELVDMQIGEGLKYNFKAIKAFWVEQYPYTNFDNKIAELATLKQDCLNEIEEIKNKETALTIRDEANISNLEKKADNYQKEINYYKDFQARIDQEPTYPTVTMIINNQPVIVAKNKIYYLSNNNVPINSIYVKTYNQGIVEKINNKDSNLLNHYNNSKPLLINYIAEAMPSEALELTIADITTIQTWGQMAGIFTSNAAILERYNSKFREYPYQIFESVLNILKDDEGNVTGGEFVNIFANESDRINGKYVDGSILRRNFELYQSTNLLEVLQERVRFQVSAEHGITLEEFDFNNADYIDDTHYVDRWKGKDSNGKTVYLRFDDIAELDIEAEPGTRLYIETGYVPEGEVGKTTTVTIGATGRYTLKPIDDAIKTIIFAQPTYALINYKCLNSLIRYGDEVQTNV